MSRAMQWLMSQPADQRIETAAFIIDQLSGPPERAAWISDHLRVPPMIGQVAAALEAASGRFVTVDHISMAIWRERCDDRTSDGIKVAIHRLRKVLPPGAITTSWGTSRYRLNIPLPVPPQPDLVSFEAIISAQAPKPERDFCENAHKVWSYQDDFDLLAMVESGSILPAIAYELGRTERAIIERINFLKQRKDKP